MATTARKGHPQMKRTRGRHRSGVRRADWCPLYVGRHRADVIDRHRSFVAAVGVDAGMPIPTNRSHP